MSFGFPTRRISAPVDSQTYSAPLSPHLMAAGSLWLNPQEVRIHDIHRFTPLKNNITREKNQPFEDVNQQVMEFGVGHGSYKWGNWGHSPTYRSYKPRFVTGRGPPLARFLPVFLLDALKIQVDRKKTVSPSHGRLQCPYRSPPQARPGIEGCFWTNWMTTAFQKRITSWGFQNKGTTSIFETSILSTKAFHPWGKCHFFLTKKELNSIIVRRIFDGLKRIPLENIESNLGDVLGLSPDQSNSHWVPLPTKDTSFSHDFFVAILLVNKKIITTKSTQREKENTSKKSPPFWIQDDQINAVCLKTIH